MSTFTAVTWGYRGDSLGEYGGGIEFFWTGFSPGVLSGVNYFCNCFPFHFLHPHTLCLSYSFISQELIIF